MITWKIEKRNIEELRGYDKNPRKFTEKGLKDLKKSLQKCGDANIITINADNTVLGGHARLTVMKQLGYKEVDVKVPNRLLNEQEVKEVVIRLNANTAGEWDLDKLQADFELSDLEEWGLDVEFPELDEQEVKEVDVPENVETRAKLGDIWQLGNHRLMCGDSTSITDVEKLMNGEKADLLLTDPPYNMHYDGAGIIKETISNVRERIKDIVDFDPFEISFITQLNIGSYYIFTSKDLIPEYFKIFDNYKFNILTWVKTNNPPMTNNVFLPDIEYILYFHKGQRVWNNGLKPMDIYRKAYFSSRQEGHGEAGDVHPTMKPLKLLSDKILISSSKGGNVLDLFGGSGSTLIACEQLSRKCFMMELDEHYCDVIITRWENLTGKKAVLCEQ